MWEEFQKYKEEAHAARIEAAKTHLKDMMIASVIGAGLGLYILGMCLVWVIR